MKKQGLYEPFYEHDACGLGFVANIDGKKTIRLLMRELSSSATLSIGEQLAEI